MKLENQVCTLEQAKRISEAGVNYFKPQYAFVNRMEIMQLSNVDEFNRWAHQYNEPFVYERKNYPAFTVAELGVMINDSDLSAYIHDGSTGIYSKKTNSCVKIVHSIYEAHIRGEMLIYLLEENLITSEEINQRLINS
jgi:hypothetical protein